MGVAGEGCRGQAIGCLVHQFKEEFEFSSDDNRKLLNGFHQNDVIWCGFRKIVTLAAVDVAQSLSRV